MKNVKVSPNLIDLIKTNGKKILCTLVTTIMLMIPQIGKTETKTSDSINNQTKIEQRVNEKNEVDEIVEMVESMDLSTVSNEPVFVMYSNWEKTNNYSIDKSYEKDNREYQRKVYRFIANEKFNSEYFDGDYEKILRFFRDNENALSIFDVLSEEVETITLSKEEEEKLDTTHTILEVEGSDIKIEILSKSEEEKIEEEKNAQERRDIIFGSSGFLLVIAFMIHRYRKYGIMGLK